MTLPLDGGKGNEMNKDEIEKMDAGREMDDLIATEVMEWAIGDRGAHYIGNDGHNVCFIIAGDFQPSTNISAAWDVVKKLIADDDNLDIDLSTTFLGWKCEISNSSRNTFIGRDPSAPLAICRAALLAMSAAN